MLAGMGSTTQRLSDADIRGLCEEAIGKWKPDGGRVLALIPDNTRTAPVDRVFRTLCHLLEPRVTQLDFMVALGTHEPLSDAAIRKRVGITEEEQKGCYSGIRFFNHRWDDPEQTAHVGVISADEMERLSGGRMRDGINVTVNKRVFDYDSILIIGPTFPHEVVGFSGGNKYLFPGISGQAIIDAFHWLGALITNPAVIGTKDTPVRAVVDRAASFLPMERVCMSLVVAADGLAGLYIGAPEEAFSRAADLSARLHIRTKDRPFHKVLSCAPSMYEDLWTGGKCMYKLEPVVADGGELIIYAPHIREISRVHGSIIERIGYHVRDYFVEQMDRFKDVPGGVLAHSTHVKGVGTFRDGVEDPRIEVVLATGIPEEVCNRINLGYRDPESIDPEAWREREEEGVLFVPKAGEMLYRLKPESGER